MMIDRTDQLPVGKQAQLLGIGRGSVYKLPRATSQADLALMRQIDHLHLEHPFMGQRMLVRQLRCPPCQGGQVGRLQVRTLMQRMGICAMAPQPGTSRPSPGHKIYRYLLRNVRVTQTNHVWTLDTAYLPMARGFAYLTAVVDVASRRVLAHKVAITLEAFNSAEVITEALSKYGKPEIVNTDQGGHFKATNSKDVVLQAGCKLSMDGRGAWRDNVFVERLWRTIKYKHVYASVADAGNLIARHIDWYNMERPHSSLQNQTPREAYCANLPKLVSNPAQAA